MERMTGILTDWQIKFSGFFILSVLARQGKKLWKIFYGDVVNLGLEDRIVEL